MDNGTSTLRSTVDLATGAITPSASHTVTARAWGSYWYVTCAVTATASTFVVMGAEITTTGGLVTYTGDGTSSLDLWGFQLEQGGFSTSYIPTVASQVTRAADNALMLGDNFATWYSANEGTLVTNQTATGFSASNMIVALTDGGITNILQQFYNASINLRYTVQSGGSLQAEINNAITFGQNHKTASAYKANDFALVVNAGSVGTDTSGVVPVSLSQMGIGNRNGALFFNGTIRAISYYPTRLPNATLQSITS